MDKTLLNLIADKVKLCSSWANMYDKDLSESLKIIEKELREVK